MIPTPPIHNLPAQEQHNPGLETQSWAMQFDASQRNFDPALVGTQMNTSLTLAPIQSADPSQRSCAEVDGDGGQS